MPILTIAIPTFNRKKALELQLNELLKLKFEDIEILVSDNDSNDGTRQLLQSLNSELPLLNKIRNETNLGFDGNIKCLYKAASGKFVWFLSDDDLVKYEEVGPILNALINNPSIGLLGLIFNGSNSQTLNTRMVSYAASGERVRIPVGLAFSSKKSQVVQTTIGTLVSQISSCIVAKVDNLNLNFNGGGIAHTLITHLVLNHKENVLFINSNAVNLGAKEDISNWFMESCLDGVGMAYASLHKELGLENCHLVADATKILGLKIAFWSFGNDSAKFNLKLLREFEPPHARKLLIPYTMWFVLANLASRFSFFSELLFNIRIIYLKLKFKLNV
jgi:glycosyltransferase involved in cell wall biosynthesis